MGPTRDIELSERRKAERQLRESEERYRRLFETTQDGILILDFDTGQITDVNPYMISLLGYTHGEFLGKKLWEVGAFRDVIASKVYFTVLRKKGYVHYEDLPLETKEGRTIEVEFNSYSGQVNGRMAIHCNIHDITERRNVEIALLRNRAFLATLVAKAPVGFAFLDRELRYVTVNKALAKMNGIPIKKHISRTVAKVLPKLPAMAPVFKRVLKGESFRNIEIQGETPKRPGSPRSWLANYYPVKGESGAILGIGLVMVEITELKKAEADLLYERDRIKNYLDLVGVIVVAIGKDRKVIMINRKGCELLGYDEHEMVGRDWFQNFIPKRMRKEVLRTFAKVKSGKMKGVEHFENPVIARGGQERLVSWHNINVMQNDKFAYSLSSGEDVTEKREAESSLVESRSRLRQLLEFLPDPTFALDLNGKITLWNKAMADLSGLGAGRMLGKNSSAIGLHFYGRRRPVAAELLLNPDQSGDKLYDSLEKVGDMSVARNFVPRLNRGKPGYVWVMAKPIHDAGGRLVGAIESVRDVTAQKRNERELIEEKEKVEALSRARDRFIADITHELKTPLSVILLHLDMVLRNDSGRRDEGTLQSYDLMWRNAQRLSRSIEQIMHLTNLEAVSVHEEKVVLRQLMGNVVEEYLPLMRSKGLVLDIRGPELSLRCDPHLLSMVFSNFMSNAVKFTDRGKIRVRWAAEGDSVSITVSDTGMGILPENRGKIFGKFFKENPDAPGSGIGLALSSEIAKKMGGKTEYHAEPGKGSAFRIIIPRR